MLKKVMHACLTAAISVLSSFEFSTAMIKFALSLNSVDICLVFKIFSFNSLAFLHHYHKKLDLILEIFGSNLCHHLMENTFLKN